MSEQPKWYQEGKPIGDLLLKTRLTATVLAVAPVVGVVWAKRKLFPLPEPETKQEALYGCYAKPKPQTNEPTGIEDGAEDGT